MSLKNEIDLVLFDLDGTLIDNMESIWAAVIQVFETFDAPGPTLQEFCRSLFTPFNDWYRENGLGHIPAEEVQRLFYGFWIRENYQFYPGVSELLTALVKSGKHVAVITASHEEHVYKILESGNLTHHFSMIESRAQDKTEAVSKLCTNLGISPTRAVYIGDLRSDIRDGRRANIRTVAFLGTHGHNDAFISHPPDHFVHNHQELAELLLT